MTATDTAESDKAVGFTMLYGTVAVLSALLLGAAGFVATASSRGGLVMDEAATHAMEVNAAVGFGLAMTFAFLAVVAVHWYDG